MGQRVSTYAACRQSIALSSQTGLKPRVPSPDRQSLRQIKETTGGRTCEWSRAREIYGPYRVRFDDKQGVVCSPHAAPSEPKLRPQPRLYLALLTRSALGLIKRNCPVPILASRYTLLDRPPLHGLAAVLTRSSSQNAGYGARAYPPRNPAAWLW